MTTDVGSILVADDEETFRESTCRLLRREGFVCHWVKDADEAVERLHCERFDLLVADIRMPRNPDLRLIRAAREVDAQMLVRSIEVLKATKDTFKSKALADLRKELEDLLSGREGSCCRD